MWRENLQIDSDVNDSGAKEDCGWCLIFWSIIGYIQISELITCTVFMGDFRGECLVFYKWTRQFIESIYKVVILKFFTGWFNGYFQNYFNSQNR